jgi:hypothetical protein
MPRKVAFSGKQKKQQLLLKKQSKSKCMILSLCDGVSECPKKKKIQPLFH